MSEEKQYCIIWFQTGVQVMGEFRGCEGLPPSEYSYINPVEIQNNVGRDGVVQLMFLPNPAFFQSEEETFRLMPLKICNSPKEGVIAIRVITSQTHPNYVKSYESAMTQYRAAKSGIQTLQK